MYANHGGCILTIFNGFFFSEYHLFMSLVTAGLMAGCGYLHKETNILVKVLPPKEQKYDPSKVPADHRELIAKYRNM